MINLFITFYILHFVVMFDEHQVVSFALFKYNYQTILPVLVSARLLSNDGQ